MAWTLSFFLLVVAAGCSYERLNETRQRHGMDHGARRGCGAAVPEPGAGEAMALREEEEGGEGNGGDKPVAANLRVVRGLLVLADSPPPRRRRAHAVVAEAAGLRPHPYAAQAKPCLIARPIARGHGPANTVLPVAPAPRTACRLPLLGQRDDGARRSGEGAPEQASCGDRT